jgi:hypothetical protein
MCTTHSIRLNRDVCVAVRQILESQPELLFHLQQQRLIELIRGGNIESALDFAQARCYAVFVQRLDA